MIEHDASDPDEGGRPQAEHDVHVDAIRRAILAYLASKPEAADTPTGIFDWWLAPRRPEWSIGGVERALASMVRSGAVVRERLPDGLFLFRRKPRGKASETALLRSPAGLAFHPSEGSPRCHRTSS